MDLFQLETFLTVAEERSFSRAATRLHRTQPAISQVIAKLEGELGETLVERSDGSLTDAGAVLLEYARKLLNLRGDAEAALVDLRAMHTGRLRIAANEYTCLYLLPLLDAFRREHPRVKVTVQRALASRIADEVLLHTVELGVVSYRPEDPQVRSTVVYSDELVCIAAPSHPLAAEGKATIARLGNEIFAAHNVPSPMRQRVINAFRNHKTPLVMDIELPSLEAIKRFVERGTAVALVPRLVAESELASGALVKIDVPELAMERKLRLVQRKSSALSHAARAFLSIVEKYATTHGGPYTYLAERNS